MEPSRGLDPVDGAGLAEPKPPSVEDPRSGLVPKLFARRINALAPLVDLRAAFGWGVGAGCEAKSSR